MGTHKHFSFVDIHRLVDPIICNICKLYRQNTNFFATVLPSVAGNKIILNEIYFAVIRTIQSCIWNYGICRYKLVDINATLFYVRATGGVPLELFEKFKIIFAT